MQVQVKDFADTEMLSPYAGRARIPDHRDKIFKDECLFSFDSPECETGLYVCMEKFYGFGRKYVEDYHRKTGRSLFLHLRQIKREVENPKNGPSEDGNIAEPPAEKVSKLAIGVEGGFDLDTKKYTYEDKNTIVLLPGFHTFKIDEKLPTMISMCATEILKAESAVTKRELEEAANSWEGEQLVNSKYAENLEQLQNGVKVPPRGWKCERCDKVDNLWMNLTDGAINCGRKNFDGSGGNNHAVEHYAQTNYPLAVKLGTITSDGKADVFSYAKDEDNMVLDPYLKKHLAHFGINVAVMEKTEKSMVELEIDVNKKFEYSTITESGTQLVPIYGPGYTGMKNLGNTCYMNSVMQVLFTLPQFQEQYVKAANDIYESINFDNTAHEDNFSLQMAKLGCGLMNGEYSIEPNDTLPISNEDQVGHVKVENGIKPVMFKNLIGRGHPEFSGKQQQDAQEFFLHLLTVMERENRKRGQTNHAFSSLQFKVEDRLECGATKQVSYSSRIEDYMPLTIPVDMATNEVDYQAFEVRKREAEAKGLRLEPEETVRRIIPFEACLQQFCSDEIIDGYLSPVTKENTIARKTTRFRTFPDYLLIQLKKFDIDEKWQPYKLDVEVDMPDNIDLACLLKSTDGLQPGEVPMTNRSNNLSIGAQTTVTFQNANPSERNSSQTDNLQNLQNYGTLLNLDSETVPSQGPKIMVSDWTEPVIDMFDVDIVRQLTNMGYSEEVCKKATHHTKNSSLQAAMEWIFQHNSDPDFNEPLHDTGDAMAGAAGSVSGTSSAFVPDEQSVEQLINFGFTRAQCVKALKSTSGNMERAADWLFNHPNDNGEEESPAADGPSRNEPLANLTDGSSHYKLVAFISHMGTSTCVGHYVCHILKEGRWVIYNDEKVALSEKTPKKLGYLYLYERVQT